MELRDYLAIIRRQRWLLICTLFLTLAITTIGTALRMPVYEATTQLRLTTVREDGGGIVNYDTEYADRLMNTYANLAESAIYRQRVDGLLGFGGDAEFIVDTIPNSELMTVSARMTDAQQAADAANALADLLLGVDMGRANVANPISGYTLLIAFSADPPSTAKYPNWTLNLALATLLGSLGALALAFVFDGLDTSLSDTRSISELVKLPTLAEVPFIQNDLDHTLLGLPEVEAFRSLYSTLFQRQGGAATEVLLVTSAEQGEGKTTILINLAFALATARKRVLVIDANLRAPQAAELLGVHHDKGLSNLLSNNATVNQVIKPSGLPLISVMPAGSLRTGRLLYNPTVKQIFDDLRRHYDVILVDSPAMLQFSDAQVLMPSVDGVLLVVDKQQSRRETLEAVQLQLSNMNVKPLGVVVNAGEEVSAFGRNGLQPAHA